MLNITLSFRKNISPDRKPSPWDNWKWIMVC